MHRVNFKPVYLTPRWSKLVTTTIKMFAVMSAIEICYLVMYWWFVGKDRGEKHFGTNWSHAGTKGFDI